MLIFFLAKLVFESWMHEVYAGKEIENLLTNKQVLKSGRIFLSSAANLRREI